MSKIQAQMFPAPGTRSNILLCSIDVLPEDSYLMSVSLKVLFDI